MEKDQMVEMIRRRLKLDDQEWKIIEQNPKFQRLFKNAVEASNYRLVAEVHRFERLPFRACHRSKTDFRQFRQFAYERESGSCLSLFDAKLNDIDQCLF